MARTSSGSTIINVDLEAFDPSKEFMNNDNVEATIFKLPTYFKEGNEKAYEPRVVSIGPYHYDKPHLKPMDFYKQRAVSLFIKRSAMPNIEFYKSELMKNVKELKGSYAQLAQEWQENDNRFIELMILDGCFILEYLSAKNYFTEDIVFRSLSKLEYSEAVCEDLLMMENQVPYNVLLSLWATAHPDQPEMARQVLPEMLISRDEGPKPHHLLDLVSVRVREGQVTQMITETPTGYSASELYKQFGINCKKAEVRDFKNIKFDVESATLSLPCITINTHRRTPYLNMMAFQFWGSDKNFEFHSYIHLLGTLVQSTEDVMILRSKKIITTGPFPDNEAVLDIVKLLNKNVGLGILSSSSAALLVLQEMNKYFERRDIKIKRKIRIWLRNLRDNYFSNPWTIISVLAAAFILVLTFIQTVYSVRSFNSSNGNHKKSA